MHSGHGAVLVVSRVRVVPNVLRASNTGDHKGRPYARSASRRRGRACPVPLSRQTGAFGTGDDKRRPYGPRRIVTTAMIGHTVL